MYLPVRSLIHVVVVVVVMQGGQEGVRVECGLCQHPAGHALHARHHLPRHVADQRSVQQPIY